MIAAAHERGLTLPDELSVTGYDDVDLARTIWPGLTTARQPLEEMAGIATRQLLVRMHPRRQWDDPPPSQVMFEAELVQRGSVGAPACKRPAASP